MGLVHVVDGPDVKLLLFHGVHHHFRQHQVLNVPLPAKQGHSQVVAIVGEGSQAGLSRVQFKGGIE